MTTTEQGRVSIKDVAERAGVSIGTVSNVVDRPDRRQGIPHVVVDGSAAGAACSVSVDDVVGGELAARHLVEAGHRSIAYVTGPLDLPQCRDRRIGASEAGS